MTDGYQPNRDSGECRVARSALRANPTERLKELAAPIIRDTMDHVQFDPLAFQVSLLNLKRSLFVTQNIILFLNSNYSES